MARPQRDRGKAEEGIRITASLHFNDEGALVNFVPADLCALAIKYLNPGYY